MKKRHLLTAVASAALLAACGGGDGDAGSDAEARRGNLRETPQLLATLTAVQIDAATAASGAQALTGKAKCDVRVVGLDYETIGVNGEATNSSGVMLVPAGACAGGSYPLVAHAKGTDVRKPRTLANPADGETQLLAAIYAAQGYAVVATDYLGFAKSTYPYHPYLHADSEATTVIDSVRAARQAAAQQSVTLSGRVLLAGYSQGGHASAATQRAMERDHAGEFNVVGAAHMAGPYNLTGQLRGPTILGYQFFAPYIITSWQKAYGNIYTNASQVFKAPYATGIDNLLPHPTLTTTTLVSTGVLPGGPGVTPNQVRDALIQPAFLADVQSNNNNALYQAAKRNDLLGWNPRARTLLCGSTGDPTVPAALHMAVAQADFTSRGLSNVTSVDVDPAVRAVYGINGQAPTDPASAAYATYYTTYHGTLEPPFCHAQAKALFDTLK